VAASAPPYSGDELLTAVSEAMVAYHARYYRRKPATAKTQLLGDDLLACVLGDVYNDVERMMIALGRQPLVHETRSAFQDAKGHEFVATVERLSGRTVVGFMSTSHVDPDLEVEMFMLAADGTTDEFWESPPS
jgi:uncharacterized protein YbcI